MISVAPHSMKISFKRDLFDGTQLSSFFVLVPCRGVGCFIFSTVGFWIGVYVRELIRQYLGMEWQNDMFYSDEMEMWSWQL